VSANASLNTAARQHLGWALSSLVEHLHGVSQAVSKRLDHYIAAPPELDEFIGAVNQLLEKVRGVGSETQFLLTDEQLAITRTALAHYRRDAAERVEKTQRVLIKPMQIEAAKNEIRPLDQMLDSSWLSRVDPRPLPRLASYLTVQGRERLEESGKLAPEVGDPKHQILLSSALLPNDLSVFRDRCEDRRLPFAVVYADIDDFKDFNSAKDEVYVDRLILPPILNALEVASYGHGRVYRHGGDEFVLLLPNATAELAVIITSSLARSIEALTFADVPHQPHLSAGIWITHPESHLTSTELVERAANAKKNSKGKKGKNRITVRVEKASYFEETIEEVKP